MKFSIIIPTKERGKVFDQTLTAAYEAIEESDAEIIIINDSKKESPKIPSNYLEKVTLLNHPKTGVASARNFGALNAKGEWLIFMDDDIIISKNNISDAITFMNEYKNENACLNLNWQYPADVIDKLPRFQFGRYIINYGFHSLEGRGWLNHSFENRNQIQIINSAASFFLVIRKDLFKSIEGYSELFSFSGFEDYDFAKKLNNNNIVCYILPASIVSHNEVDRLDIDKWMGRKYRAAITRRQAVMAGHSDLKLNHNITKLFVYSLLVYFKPVIYRILGAIPNYKLFDKLYFKLLNVLLGTSIFQGYYQKPTLNE